MTKIDHFLYEIERKNISYGSKRWIVEVDNYFPLLFPIKLYIQFLKISAYFLMMFSYVCIGLTIASLFVMVFYKLGLGFQMLIAFLLTSGITFIISMIAMYTSEATAEKNRPDLSWEAVKKYKVSEKVKIHD